MTALVTRANRYGADVFLSSPVGTIPLDATVSEMFTLPVGFGDMLIRAVSASITALSGAYAAPTPAEWGIEIHLEDANGASAVDVLGAGRFVQFRTDTARPGFIYVVEFQQRRFMAGTDRIVVVAPIIAGAGVTGTISCNVTGLRINSG